MSDPVQARRGVLLILSSPSGAGKSTLSRTLIETDKNIELSVSVTTRDRRPSEVEGVHYHFIDRRTFERMRDGNDLLEWAEVHGNMYGTPREPVQKALASRRDILFDIDYQGALQLYDRMRDDVCGVFILPPSGCELKTRLERRAEDASGVISRRLVNARVEIAHWEDYDYVLINDDLGKTFTELTHILAAERLRRVRQNHLVDVVSQLDAELATLTA